MVVLGRTFLSLLKVIYSVYKFLEVCCLGSLNQFCPQSKKKVLHCMSKKKKKSCDMVFFLSSEFIISLFLQSWES